MAIFRHIPNREGHDLKISWEAAFPPLVDFPTQYRSIDEISVKRHVKEIWCLSLGKDGRVDPCIWCPVKEMVTMMTH